MKPSAEKMILVVLLVLTLCLAALLVLLMTNNIHILVNGAIAVGPYPNHWLCYPSWGACQ